MTDLTDSVQAFVTSIPEHDCIGEDCEYPPGFVAIVHKNGVMADITLHTHNLSPYDLVSMFLRAAEARLLEDPPDGMPKSIAFAQFREMIRRMSESMPIPAEISSDLHDLMDQIMEDSDDE